MLESFYGWMERKGRRIGTPTLYRLGWAGTFAGFALLGLLVWQGSHDLLDWFWGVLLLGFRPYMGWIVSRIESMRPPG